MEDSWKLILPVALALMEVVRWPQCMPTFCRAYTCLSQPFLLAVLFACSTLSANAYWLFLSHLNWPNLSFNSLPWKSRNPNVGVNSRFEFEINFRFKLRKISSPRWSSQRFYSDALQVLESCWGLLRRFWSWARLPHNKDNLVHALHRSRHTRYKTVQCCPNKPRNRKFQWPVSLDSSVGGQVL